MLVTLAKLGGQNLDGCRTTIAVVVSDRSLYRSYAPPGAECLLLSLNVKCSLNFETLVHNDILVLCKIFLL